MAIAVACHVEPVVESGVMSIVVTCQSMMEPRGIHYRKWSRVVAITVACQGVQACRPKLGQRLSVDEAWFHAESGRRSIGSGCRMALERFTRWRGPAARARVS